MAAAVWWRSSPTLLRHLLQAGQIDIAISPAAGDHRHAARHVRRGHVTQVHSLRRGAAEALEAVVHGAAIRALRRPKNRGGRSAEGSGDRGDRARRR